MRRVPLYAGEFGLEIRFRVPVVYTMGLRGPVAVEIESGKQALYPSAAEWRVIDRVPEDTVTRSRDRGSRGRPKVTGPEKRFLPEPHVPQGVEPPDVVVGPRRRHYVSQKNWEQWPAFVEMLKGSGLRVFAGGVADASDTRVDCPAGWDYARPLDATIEALRAARLFIAPCSGLAHLAVLCGTPTLIVTYRGLDAPGPVITSSGRKKADKRWPVRMQEYYHDANHTGTRIEQVDGWEHPERVLRRVVDLLGERAA